MEVRMTRKKRKTVSFDAMVKFFIRNYEIPTKKDLDVLNERLDRIERHILAQSGAAGRAGAVKTGSIGGAGKAKPAVTASQQVFNFIKSSKEGVRIADIKAKTGYEDKKLRNIIFRLHSMKRIKRVSRGVYKAAD
jgi:hypothetical protein